MLHQQLYKQIQSHYQKQLDIQKILQVFPKALDRVEQLGKIQGYTYATPHLPLIALLHRSALVHWPKSTHGTRTGIFSNERLEFLGDSFLNYSIALEVMSAQKEDTEGELSRFRSTLVCASRLSQKAKILGLSECILLGPKVDPGPNVLADVFEAVTASLLIVGGQEKAWSWLREVFQKELQGDVVKEDLNALDTKSKFQQWVQSFAKTVPTYRVVNVGAQEKEQSLFAVGVFIGQTEIARGVSSSKRRASQKAAERAWEMVRLGQLSQEQALIYLERKIGTITT